MSGQFLFQNFRSQQVGAARDPRQNRGKFNHKVCFEFEKCLYQLMPKNRPYIFFRIITGPVVFPPSPPDAIDESSGVIVGASGYGFVPPQQSNNVY